MAATKSIAAGGNATSEIVVAVTDCVEIEVQCRADNDGTPASGDTVTFKALTTTGDVDANPDVTNDFATTDGVNALTLLDVSTAAKDPAQSGLLSLAPGTIEFKIHALNNSAGRAITVSAQARQQDKDGVWTKSEIDWL